CSKCGEGSCGVVCCVFCVCVVSGACVGDDKYVVQVGVLDCLVGECSHRSSLFVQGLFFDCRVCAHPVFTIRACLSTEYSRSIEQQRLRLLIFTVGNSALKRLGMPLRSMC